MKVEPNHRSAFNHALSEGDFVDVRFNSALDSGYYGFVIWASRHRLRLKAHAAVGRFEPAVDRECLDLDLVIPMTSIAWIRHLPGKPANCKCRDGLS